jgi:hypothetical protein
MCHDIYISVRKEMGWEGSFQIVIREVDCEEEGMDGTGSGT